MKSGGYNYRLSLRVLNSQCVDNCNYRANERKCLWDWYISSNPSRNILQLLALYIYDCSTAKKKKNVLISYSVV